jgi:hypothetical protein
MREDCLSHLIHQINDVLQGEWQQSLNVGIRVHPNILQGHFEGREAFAFQEGADCRDAIGWPINTVLHPNFLQIVDEVNPLLGSSFFKDVNKLFACGRTRWLSSTGLAFKGNELRFVLLLCIPFACGSQLGLHS